MGTYYHLVNDTRGHRVHLDNHIKAGPLRLNPAVHAALVAYMMDNLGDVLRMVPDTTDDKSDHYEDVDLLQYHFCDNTALPRIKSAMAAVQRGIA